MTFFWYRNYRAYTFIDANTKRGKAYLDIFRDKAPEGEQGLYDCYDKPSKAKWEAWHTIVRYHDFATITSHTCFNFTVMATNKGMPVLFVYTRDNQYVIADKQVIEEYKSTHPNYDFIMERG